MAQAVVAEAEAEAEADRTIRIMPMTEPATEAQAVEEAEPEAREEEADMAEEDHLVYTFQITELPEYLIIAEYLPVWQV
jgi:hypothetical protein